MFHQISSPRSHPFSKLIFTSNHLIYLTAFLPMAVGLVVTVAVVYRATSMLFYCYFMFRYVVRWLFHAAWALRVINQPSVAVVFLGLSFCFYFAATEMQVSRSQMGRAKRRAFIRRRYFDEWTDRGYVVSFKLFLGQVRLENGASTTTNIFHPTIMYLMCNRIQLWRSSGHISQFIRTSVLVQKKMNGLIWRECTTCRNDSLITTLIT